MRINCSGINVYSISGRNNFKTIFGCKNKLGFLGFSSHYMFDFADKTESVSYGLVIKKHLGPASKRNKIKRRIREILRSVNESLYLQGCAYVFVFYPTIFDRNFISFKKDVERCLEIITQKHNNITASNN